LQTRSKSQKQTVAAKTSVTSIISSVTGCLGPQAVIQIVR
jgi:hypothetical protein